MADFGSGGNGPFHALLSRSLGVEVVTVSRCGNTYSDRGDQDGRGAVLAGWPPSVWMFNLRYIYDVFPLYAYTSEGEVIGFPPLGGFYFKDPAW